MSLQERQSTVDYRLLRNYLGFSLVGHLIWETLQLPLYTLWTTGTGQQKAFAIAHCTVGDVLIAAASVLAAWAVFARSRGANAGVAPVWAASLALGLGYTFFSEWLNTGVRANWTYSDLMPVVPLIGQVSLLCFSGSSSRHSPCGLRSAGHRGSTTKLACDGVQNA